MDNPDILRHLYYLCTNGSHQLASEVALDYLNRELLQDHFAHVDALLGEADAERLASIVLLVVLSITGYARDRLPQRLRFLEVAEQKMISELGKERTEKLLEMRR